MIRHGDCLEVMAAMEPESVDAIVCDPPYGLEFMGVAWDTMRDGGTPRPRNEWGDFGSREHARGQDDLARVNRKKSLALQAFSETWAREAYRVAKPSAYLLAFGGTRTVHRLASAIEDAGWIIRDTLVWAYASGFPKSKASLKPAWEPIIMARKPGPLRELAIDACRIPTDYAAEYGETWLRSGRQATPDETWQGPGEKAEGSTVADRVSPLGRWPANVILTDPIFDGDTPGVVGGGQTTSGLATRRSPTDDSYSGGWAGAEQVEATYGDSGTYSRFFLIPKADRADREPVIGQGLEGSTPGQPRLQLSRRAYLGRNGANPCPMPGATRIRRSSRPN